MVTTGIIVLVAAVLVVLATSIFKNVNWSDKVKNLVATVLSVVAAVIGLLGGNGWDVSAFGGADVLETALLVYGASQLIYKFIFNGTRFNEVLEESVNTPGRHEA